ncbi:hypothetical protein MKX08_009022 [Trichoderma sp. CBMAI-0020]|nr:hypothetical protein MKX08_009022 [Trichoderma sp. CBMAI-0020]
MEPQNEHNLGSSIAELADGCRRSLKACTQIEALMQYEWAENRLAEFKLWAAGSGAFASDKASLDARLSVNWETKSLIKNLLTLLTGCIEKCQMIDEALPGLYSREAQGMSISTSIGHQGASDPIPRPFSPWSESSSTDSESEEELNLHVPLPNTSALQSARAEVEHMIDYLSRLAVAVRKSGTISRYQKADQLFKEEDYQDLFQHLVLVVLSQGSEEGREQYDVDPKSLNAIQKRLIMSNLQRRNRFQYAQRHAQKLAFDTLNLRNHFEAPVPKNLVLLSSEPNRIQPTGPDYTQTTGEQSIPHDTGARFPKAVTAITATKASAVGTTIEAWTTLAHLGFKRAFDSFNALAAVRRFPVCFGRGHNGTSVMFTSIEEFIEHTKLHHGDSITEDQHATLISAAARPVPLDITRCPLCDQTGPVDSDELLDHIAEHVHTFSLRSLPWPDESGTHGHKANFFNDHDYFEDGSDGHSHNVSNSSTRDAKDPGSLPSNASLTQDGFSTGVDERSMELMEVGHSLRAGSWESQSSHRGLPYDNYKIAIICDSQLALAAIRALFDEIHLDIERHPGGNNRYALGRLGAHYALATCPRLGNYDYKLASDIEKSFPNVKSYFAVGVGGGIPSERHDIRLGDVVVSTGIIRFDVERVMQQKGGAEFIQHAATPLLAAMSSVQSDESLLYNVLKGHIENIVSSEPGYQSPGEDRDMIFPAASKHKRRQATCEDCEGPHVQRRPRLPGPHIHHGFIGSVNRTVDDAVSRDYLGTKMDVLSFEGHGVGGLMTARTCLMIQGICDYADSHSNDEWHKYAAATAAAFTKVFLLLKPDHVDSREIP